MSREFELAAMFRADLIFTAQYSLLPDGTQDALMNVSGGPIDAPIGIRIEAAIQELLGRSLAIRQVGRRLLQRMRAGDFRAE